MRRGTDQIQLVASDGEEHGDAAIGLGTRCRHELNTSSCHLRVYGPEIFHVEEETDPASGLSAHHSGLVFSVSLREEQAGHGARRADHDPSLGAPVIGQGRESSTSSKPSTSTKKLTAGSYSLTTTAMRPRCTAPA